MARGQYHTFSYKFTHVFHILAINCNPVHDMVPRTIVQRENRTGAEERRRERTVSSRDERSVELLSPLLLLLLLLFLLPLIL